MNKIVLLHSGKPRPSPGIPAPLLQHPCQIRLHAFITQGRRILGVTCCSSVKVGNKFLESFVTARPGGLLRDGMDDDCGDTN